MNQEPMFGFGSEAHVKNMEQGGQDDFDSIDFFDEPNDESKAEAREGMGRGQGHQQDPYVFKVLASTQCVGAILGTGGATINGIMNDTGCQVSSARKDDLFPGTEYRVVYVAARSAEALYAGVQRILALIPDIAAGATNPKVKADCVGKLDNEFRFHFTMPKLACASLIGKAGEDIKELRTSTNCKIDIARESVNYGPVPESVCQVVGELPQIEIVLQRVIASMEKEQHTEWFRRWSEHKDRRSAGTAKESLSNNRRGGRGGREGSRRDGRDRSEERGKNDRRGRRDGRGGDRNGDASGGKARRSRSRSRSRGRREEERGAARGGGGGEKKKGGPLEHLIRDQVATIQAMKNVQMTVDVCTKVPADLAGCLIGQRGQVVRGMCQTTGSNITIKDQAVNGEREVEFQGGPLEVAAALLTCWGKLMDKVHQEAKVGDQEEAIKAQLADLNKKLLSLREGGRS